MAKQAAILELQVDPSDLLKDAAASKKAILDLKAEQNELNKSFKAGTVDVNKYAAETVKLEQRLKREQETYNNLTKAINTQSGSLDAQRLKLSQLNKERNSLNKTTQQGVKEFDRLTNEIKQLNDEISEHEKKAGQFQRNVGNYGEKFKEAAQNINVAGVSVGGLATQISSLANPVTAAIGVIGALGAAYARSTIGAKDLEFAQNQLAIATTLVTNKFAELFSSGEDGEGFLTTALNNVDKFLVAFGPIPALLSSKVKDLLKESKEQALILEQLEDLRRTEVDLRNQSNELLADNQDLLTELQSDQIDYNEKISITNKIVTNINNGSNSVLDNLKEQLALIDAQIESNEYNEGFIDARLQIEKEISALEKDKAKRINAIIRQEQNLTEEYKKQQAALEFVRKRTGKSGTVSGVSGTSNQEISDNLQAAGQTPVDATKFIEAAKTKIEKDESIKRTKQAADEFRAKQALREQDLDNTQKTISMVSGLFEEQSAAYKVLATSQALIDTYRGATSALAPPPIGAGPVFGPILAAATIAQGLANISQINGFAEGGWTGPGDKYKPAGIVHADEYVTPKHIVHNPAAQPHIAALERMRTAPGYADGGFVTNLNTSAANQNLALMSIIKNLPAPIVDTREFISTQERIKKRESVVKLGSR